jgi:quinoprotein glucose dehydrogenase
VTKTGFCYVLERTTGKPLFEVKEVPATPSDTPGEQAHPTQPVPSSRRRWPSCGSPRPT